MDKIWDILKQYAVSYGVRIIVAFAVLFVGLKLIKIVTNRIRNRVSIKSIDPSAASFIRSLVSITLKVLIFVISIGILGVPMTSVITILGTASLAVGLALQGSLSNFAGGFMILLFKPFKVGDYIDNHTDNGTVTDISVFYTTLETPDKKLITIPNGSLSNATVVNYSASDKRRVDIDVSISYDSDIDKAKEILILLAQQNKLSIAEPAPFTAVTAHGDSAVKLVLRVWCKSSDYWTLYYELMENIKKAFDKTDIEIPYSCLNIYKKG